MSDLARSLRNVGTSSTAEPAAGGVRVLVLGPLAVERGGCEMHVAGSHRRRLLAFLASRAGQVVSTDAIADAL